MCFLYFSFSQEVVLIDFQPFNLMFGFDYVSVFVYGGYWQMFEALNAPGGSLGPHEPSPESMRAEAMKVLSPLIYGHMAAMSLRAAVILGIPDIINRAGPGNTMSLQEIASQLCSESPDLHALRRLMRVLVHFGVFSATNEKDCELGLGGSSEEINCGKLEDSHGVQYGLTVASKMLVRANNTFEGSIPSSVLFLNHPMSQKPWEHIHESILCGKVPNEVAHGKIYEVYVMTTNYVCSLSLIIIHAHILFGLGRFVKIKEF